jgi:hypothetical protein
MRAANPLISRRNIASIVRNTAIKKGSIKIGGVDQDPALNPAARYDPSTGHNRHMGFGMLNALEALQDASTTPGIGNVQMDLSGTGRDVNPGEQIRITWDSSLLENDETIDVDLLDLNGNVYPVWSDAPANVPGLIWTIPSNFPIDRYHRVRIRVPDQSRVVSFSDGLLLISNHWIRTTSTHDICDQDVYTLTWETSYPETRDILLEVETGEDTGTQLISNSGSYDVDLLGLNEILRDQSIDPANYIEQITFNIRLLDASDGQVVSEWQQIRFGINFFQPCDLDLPIE